MRKVSGCLGPEVFTRQQRGSSFSSSSFSARHSATRRAVMFPVSFQRLAIHRRRRSLPSFSSSLNRRLPRTRQAAKFRRRLWCQLRWSRRDRRSCASCSSFSSSWRFPVLAVRRPEVFDFVNKMKSNDCTTNTYLNGFFHHVNILAGSFTRFVELQTIFNLFL